jgi:D-glycero-D-manno-heptose 1,7-bisphosphate phosphatase
MVTARAVFLDRDGVLNRAMIRDGRPYPPDDLASFVILPGVVDACQQLKAAGFYLIVATNQPDVATGKQRRAVVETMHQQLRTLLPLDGIEVCYETDGPDSHCYKPRPGMLLRAAQTYGIELACSFMVGDRWRDVGAGFNAGCKTCFIDHGYDEPMPYAPDFIGHSLADVAGWILQHAKP